MVSIDFDASAVRALAGRFSLVNVRLGADMQRAVRAGAQLLVAEGKARVPVKSGDLQGSIHVRGASGFSASVIVDALNESGIPYGGYVEYGTSFTPAQPFMGPARDATDPKFTALAASAVLRAMAAL